MINRGKLFFGVLTSLTLVFGSVATSFANENVVSKTQDNITVTKTAEWTTLNGQATDANGNPYAKINFKIDTTNATTEITNTVSRGGDTDIVMLLDDSGSMAGTKINQLKEAANNFTRDVLAIQNVKVRVGLVSFATNATKLSDLTESSNGFSSSIASLRATGGTNLHKALPIANEMLSNSPARNKFYIILTDGGVSQSANCQSLIATAKSQMSNLKVITIGYSAGSSGSSFLKSVSTTDANNQPMYYDAAVSSSNIVSNIQGVFEQITEEVTSYVIGNSLVDTIPAQFSIVDGTITTNDQNLVADISADKKTINWNWGENKLEKKVYEMSVITVLDKSQVPADYTKVNTNGTTIDPSVDSSNSAIFSYGSTNTLGLSSPKLSLMSEEQVNDNNNQQAGNQADDNITTDNNNQNDDTPSTGDDFNVAILALMAVCGVAIIGIGVKIKKQK